MNKEELIKESLTEQIKTRDELIHELNEEIEKLMAENDNMERTLKIKQNHMYIEEIKRLNNNWIELEQWIEKERDKWEKYNPDCFVYYQSILDRMEEFNVGVDN